MNIAEILLQRVAEMGDGAALVDVHRNRDRSYSGDKFAPSALGLFD